MEYLRIFFNTPEILGGKRSRVIAFNFAEVTEARCDQACRSGYLGHSWEITPELMRLTVGLKTLTFSNAESAIHELKFWNTHGEEFQEVSG